jgi:hypothetical protein
MKQGASVYKKEQQYFVASMSQTTSRVWLGGSATVLSEPIDDAVMGRAVLGALASSRVGIPHPRPQEWPAHEKEFLKEVGAKTWAQFSRGALFSCIWLEGQTLTFVPEENRGARGGFVPIEGAAFQLQLDAGPSEIGLALRKAFALSR